MSKPHPQEILEDTATYSKPWREKIHEKDLRETFKWILRGLFLLLLFTVLYVWLANTDLFWDAATHSNARNNWYFIVSVLISIYSAYFTLSAYWIARKVEEYVRTPIYDYADFIEQAKKVLETGRPDFRIMVYYPYFSIDEYVESKGGQLIDRLLNEISKSPNKSVKLYILNEPERERFLKDMENKVGVETDHISTVQAHFNELKKRFQNKELANETKEHRDGKFPIQMFWSSNLMTFVASPKDYPNNNLKCSGFTSRDPAILEAFKMIFDDYYRNQCLSSMVKTKIGTSRPQTIQDTGAEAQLAPVSEEQSSQENIGDPASNQTKEVPAYSISDPLSGSRTKAKAVTASPRMDSQEEDVLSGNGAGDKGDNDGSSNGADDDDTGTEHTTEQQKQG